MPLVRLVLVPVLVAALGPAAVPVGGTASAQQAGSLVLIYDGAAEMGRFYDEVLPQFEREHPGVTVDVFVATGGVVGIVERVRVMVASGAQLDVVEFWAEGASALYADDILLDLRPYAEKEGDLLGRLLATRLQGYTWNGRLLGIPLNANAFPMFYNATLMTEAGLPLPPQQGSAWDWAALVEAAKRLTVDRDGDGTPDTWGLRSGSSLDRFPSWLHNAGGGLFDRPDNPTRARLTEPASLEGLRFLVSLYQEHQVTRVGSLPAFATGRLGFDFDSGPFLMSNLAEAGVSFDWGLYHRPAGPGNNGTIILGTGYIIPKSAADPDLSWELVKFLAGREETVRRMYEITKRTPAYIPVLADYARHLEEAFGPGAAPIDEIANNPANYTGISSPYRPEFQSLIQDGIAMMLDGRAAVESTAAELERQVNAILRQGEVPAD